MPRQERGNTRARARRGEERTLRLEHVMATRHPPPTGNFRGSVPFTPHSSYIPWREEETSGGGRRTPLYICGLCRPLVSLTRQTWMALLCDFDVNCARHAHAHAKRQGIRGMPRERGENTDRVRSIERY